MKLPTVNRLKTQPVVQHFHPNVWRKSRANELFRSPTTQKDTVPTAISDKIIPTQHNPRTPGPYTQQVTENVYILMLKKFPTAQSLKTQPST